MFKIFDSLHKCVFCGERGGNIEKVDGFGIYYDSKKYFHRGCLHSVMCDPEHYGHKQVDMAIVIIDKLKKKKEKVKAIKKEYKNNCKKLSEYCDEDILF